MGTRLKVPNLKKEKGTLSTLNRSCWFITRWHVTTAILAAKMTLWLTHHFNFIDSATLVGGRVKTARRSLVVDGWDDGPVWSYLFLEPPTSALSTSSPPLASLRYWPPRPVQSIYHSVQPCCTFTHFDTLDWISIWVQLCTALTI